MGGKVIREAVNDQAEREGSGRHGRMTLRMSSAWGRRRSQRSAGNSGWVDAKVEMRWFLAVLTDFSAGLDLCICGETKCTGNRCKRKYSLHSNEVSL